MRMEKLREKASSISEKRTTDTPPNLNEGLVMKSSFHSDESYSADVVLSPELLLQGSDPNTVLTNPDIVTYLRKLHEKATQRPERYEDDFNERRLQLRSKVDAFNKRSEVGAFRVKFEEAPDEIGYSGPVKFYYQVPGTKSESFRLMTLTDHDSVKNILPKLRQKFAIPEDVKCTMREIINGDEILLDPDDRPLELNVNSKSPLTFHVVTGGDRNAELLQNLRHESFTPEQRRRLIEKFNLNTDTEDNNTKSWEISSSSTSRHRTSLSGSSNSGSINQLTDDNKMSSLTHTEPKARSNGHGNVTRKLSLQQENDTSNKPSPQIRSKTITRTQRPFTLPTATERQGSKTREGRKRNVKSKNNADSEHREGRSASARRLFHSLRKYRSRSRSSSRDRNRSKTSSLNSDAEDSVQTSQTTELSSNANTPGILKIFGDDVSPGANYKSIMATTQSNSKELVKIALERYGISKSQYKSYMLCEVVGRFKEERKRRSFQALKIKGRENKKKTDSFALKFDEMSLQGAAFIEDYVRPLNDHEKPLVLQSYWKPLDGHCRRFELRRKSEIFKKETKDHTTRDINKQAKRLIIQKSKSNKSLPTFHALPIEPQTDSEASSYEGDDKAFRNKIPNSKQTVKTTVQSTTQNSSSASLSASSNYTPTKDFVNEDSVTKSSQIKTNDTTPAPYFITLQGNEDNLIHTLDKCEILIGNDVTDFKVVAPDILRHHCIVKRRLEILFSESNNGTVKRWLVTITPLHADAEVLVNGSQVTDTHTLEHGEILSIGKHHIFMYKDPLSHINLSNIVSFSFSDKNKLKDTKICSTENQVIEQVDLSQNVLLQLPKTIETELSYEPTYEDRVLDVIFGAVQDLTDVSLEYPLTPAHLLCQCIIHSCLNFDLHQKNELLLKIASNLQTIILNATKNISVQQIQSSIDSGQHVYLLPLLRRIVFWMSNSLEIFNFLQKDLIPIIQHRVEEETKKNLVDSKLLIDAKEFRISDEILALLEEVVMYAFQQVVYYLTKTLYSSLHAILDCNPFADQQPSGLSIKDVTDVYGCAREMTQMYHVNERIEDQLFAYLFFFTNVSLFNNLMEEDSSSKYYSWEMGVRIRGNIEQVESWAIDNGFMDQATTYLEKISSLATLLATPKSQLIKGKWSLFRKTFPSVTPASLKKVLSGYQMPSNQMRPKAWNPDMEDMDEAMNEDQIMESYDNHPPLMLPVAGSKINFRVIPNDIWFQNILQKVKEAGTKSSKELTISVREQPDGHELSNEEMSSSLHASQCFDGNGNVLKGLEGDSLKLEKILYVTKKSSVAEQTTMIKSEKMSETTSNDGVGRVVSSSSCSLSSESEGYVIKHHKSPHQQRKQSRIANEAPDPTNDLADTGLPSIGSASSSPQSLQGMPKEVFIVDIKKGKTGLGVGLVDGTVTSLAIPGVFVRSLIPDGPSVKHTRTKHHDIIKCWLQEGRMQLGDRILAANGISLVSLSYHQAIRTIRHAGNDIRLLVGRCGSDVAMKITSSSC